MPTHARPTHAQPAPPHVLDPLDPRILLTAQFAGLGMVFGPTVTGSAGVEVFLEEGELDDDLNVTTGEYWVDGNGGRRSGDDELWYRRIHPTDDGRYVREDNEGFFSSTPVETNGAQYLLDDGFPAGWWFGEYGDSFEELELLVQIPGSGVTASTFDGSYNYTAIGFSFLTGRYFTASGSLTIDTDDDEVRYSGDYPFDETSIEDIESRGLLRTDQEEYFYISADGRTVIFADTDTGDGTASIGIATRTDSPDAAALIGGYNLAWGAVIGGGINYSQFRLDLEADGDYKLYNLDDWDSGIFEALEEGEWDVSGSTLTLDEDDGGDTTFRIGQDGLILIPQTEEVGSGTVAVFGLGTRDIDSTGGGPDDRVVLSTPGVNAEGRPAVFQLERDGLWYQIDLLDATGAPAITDGSLVTWVDAATGASQAAAITTSGLVLFTEASDTTWSYRILTDEIAQSAAIASELQLMISPDGLAHLVGLSASGDVLHFAQTTTAAPSGGSVWSFENISAEDLTPAGLETPEIGGLVAYATSWGGLNIAGLDDAGTIWSVWTSPGLAGWTISDLTTAYGADPLTGGLTVYLTSWNGINIGGIDSDGALRVSWWVPEFGGEWAQSSLTELTSGPRLDPATVSSFVTTWDGLNVVGVDLETGDVVTYWWAPAATSWTVSSLTDATPAGSPVISTGPVTGLAGRDASLNVFGYAASGAFLRYSWYPDLTWTSVNLTSSATVR